jgi:hypothetical protein
MLAKFGSVVASVLARLSRARFGRPVGNEAESGAKTSSARLIAEQALDLFVAHGLELGDEKALGVTPEVATTVHSVGP